MSAALDLPLAESTLEQRKDHHIDLCLNADVGGHIPNEFDRISLVHDALPELDLRKIDTSATLLGKKLSAPFVIGAMTGGTPRAARINAILAEAACRTGVALAMGSQRAAIEDPELLSTYGGSQPRLKIGNVGAVQLNYGVTRDHLLRLIEGSRLDALALHLNPLQEAIQPEGDSDFGRLREKIACLVPTLGVPILLKEVGSGLSAELARWAASIGVACLETAGVGGTSWAAVEGFRGGDRTRRLGEVFRNFGLSTARSIAACRAGAPDIPVVASGGIRSGLDGAKTIAMGAGAFAMARPLLLAAHQGSTHDERVASVAELISTIIEELRIAMFCTSSPDIERLRHCDSSPTLQRAREWT